jgi:hypothetical protein
MSGTFTNEQSKKKRSGVNNTDLVLVLTGFIGWCNAGIFE